MASSTQSLMLLTIIALLVSAHAGARAQQVQPDHCTRSNLSQSGMHCTPNDACPFICDKLKGRDGKCEEGACMCTFCSPPSPPSVRSAARG
ncbi:hypothetical protein GQ55_1G147300 [Panicum hallii var. hallii]|uniref:Knottin scorpion toxin-like domain-containing protein n=1 Tax=Panicum hallii var. hallii TaxID=1504633 RepID=A0A2T7F5D7_9POAL|nr:hypothetical protein GQ55_1G147300 [Panicum hallii var. hallii]